MLLRMETSFPQYQVICCWGKVRWAQTVTCCHPADVLLVPLQNRGKGGAVSKLMESMAAEEDFEPNQDSSFSEDENIPLSMLVERPATPGEGRRGWGLILQVAELGRFPRAAQREDCAAFTCYSS